MIGIYIITNLVNEKVYVGQSVDVEVRWYYHTYDLKRNKHCNPHLQNAWNKYGENNFKFTVVEKCTQDELNQKEEYYINLYDSTSKGYNICAKPGSTTLGYKFTKEQLTYLSKAVKNRPQLSDEMKKLVAEKISRAHTGKKVSEHTRQLVRQRNLGKKLSAETKHKMSISHEGENNSNCKINANIAKQIKIKLRDKQPMTHISKELNVSYYIVQAIKRGENWSHITI